MCDWVGPRLGMSVVLLMTSPCIFGMALANKAIDFALLRFGIGFGLSAFVACQFWTACMFNVKIVGTFSPCTVPLKPPPLRISPLGVVSARRSSSAAFFLFSVGMGVC